MWKRGLLITGRVETQTQEMHFFALVYSSQLWSRGQVHTHRVRVPRPIASASHPIPFTYSPTHLADREMGQRRHQRPPGHGSPIRALYPPGSQKQSRELSYLSPWFSLEPTHSLPHRGSAGAHQPHAVT